MNGRDLLWEVGIQLIVHQQCDCFGDWGAGNWWPASKGDWSIEFHGEPPSTGSNLPVKPLAEG